jgi:hypothetical protein
VVIFILYRFIKREQHYSSEPEDMNLIYKPFDCSKCSLREYIANVSAAFELTSRVQYRLLLKFVQTKFTEVRGRHKLSV